jgi:hypothetical protein
MRGGFPHRRQHRYQFLIERRTGTGNSVRDDRSRPVD